MFNLKEAFTNNNKYNNRQYPIWERIEKLFEDCDVADKTYVGEVIIREDLGIDCEFKFIIPKDITLTTTDAFTGIKDAKTTRPGIQILITKVNNIDYPDLYIPENHPPHKFIGLFEFSPWLDMFTKRGDILSFSEVK